MDRSTVLLDIIPSPKGLDATSVLAVLVVVSATVLRSMRERARPWHLLALATLFSATLLFVCGAISIGDIAMLAGAGLLRQGAVSP